MSPSRAWLPNLALTHMFSEKPVYKGTHGKKMDGCTISPWTIFRGEFGVEKWSAIEIALSRRLGEPESLPGTDPSPDLPIKGRVGPDSERFVNSLNQRLPVKVESIAGVGQNRD